MSPQHDRLSSGSVTDKRYNLFIIAWLSVCWLFFGIYYHVFAIFSLERVSTTLFWVLVVLYHIGGAMNFLFGQFVCEIHAERKKERARRCHEWKKNTFLSNLPDEIGDII
jgi:membrane protein YqaA with SNARE-associated domain